MSRPSFFRAFLIAPLILAACGTTTGRTVPLSQPTSAASAAPAATASPSATPAASASAAPAATVPASCESIASGKGTVGDAQIVAVRVGTHEGYDRIVFEFGNRGAGVGVPPYEIKTATRPLYRSGSGFVMEVSGDPVLSITLLGGTREGVNGGTVYKGPTTFKTGFPALRELAEGGDFEATANWFAGLSGSACVTADVLSNPARLVVDIAHR
jgi:hypothetical protein